MLNSDFSLSVKESKGRKNTSGMTGGSGEISNTEDRSRLSG